MAETGVITLHVYMQWRIPGGKGGCKCTPLWASSNTKKDMLTSTDDRLNGTPLSGYRTKKLLLWLTLECFRRKFVRKQVVWTGRADCLSRKRSKWSWFCPKVGVASKFCARFARKTLLQRLFKKSWIRHSYAYSASYW